MELTIDIKDEKKYHSLLAYLKTIGVSPRSIKSGRKKRTSKTPNKLQRILLEAPTWSEKEYQMALERMEKVNQFFNR